MGIAVSLAAMIATSGLLAYQRRVIARTGSVAIRTDNLHYQSDLMLNAAGDRALATDQWLGLVGADAVFGLAIAAWLLRSAWGASSQAVNELMDKSGRPENAPPSRCGRRISRAQGHSRCPHPQQRRLRLRQFHVWIRHIGRSSKRTTGSTASRRSSSAASPARSIFMHLDPEGHTDRETMLPHELTERAT
jgi:ferrous-iron efflux pump FieF